METSEIKFIELLDFPFYYAGSDGCIYSKRGLAKQKDSYTNQMRKLKPGIDNSGNGYEFVSLPTKGKYRPRNVHKLVCEAFHGKVPKGVTVSHKDGNKFNNKPSNLVIETYTENHKRKKEHGTHDGGYKNTRALFSKDQVIEIRKLLEEGKLLHKEIAEIYGVRRENISRINNNSRYKNC
jgi:hypothetical protein